LRRFKETRVRVYPKKTMKLGFGRNPRREKETLVLVLVREKC
jgi:hypothetical protein